MIALALLLAASSPVPNQGPAMKKLSALLDERIDKPADMAATDERIRKTFEQPLAVMITDMSGFTALTKQRGILGFLAEIRRLQRLAEPVIKKNGGRWVKADADDLFVVHASAVSLYALAKDLLAAVDASNKMTGDNMGLAIGLGFGPTLAVGDEDIFGDSVNTASKLGEDTATAHEILVSETFHAQLVKELTEKKQAVPSCEKLEAGTRETKFPFLRCPS
jgi:adenylate cyclase